MAYGVSLYFDDTSDERIRVLWEVLASAGISASPPRGPLGPGAGRHCPHLSLGVAATAAEATLSERLAALAAQHAPLVLTLSSIGLFPTNEPVVYLGVVMTDRLLQLHKEVHALLAQETMGAWPYYLAGSWVAHVTLARGVARDQLGAAVQLVAGQVRLPFEVNAESLALAEITPTTAREVAVHPLGRAA